MDEATATGSRVCIEIEASFSFPRYTHLEVDGLEEEIAVAYDWEPKPCQACSSFGHKQGTYISSVSILTNFAESSPAPPALKCLVVGEAVAVGTSTPLMIPLLSNRPTDAWKMWIMLRNNAGWWTRGKILHASQPLLQHRTWILKQEMSRRVHKLHKLPSPKQASKNIRLPHT